MIYEFGVSLAGKLFPPPGFPEGLLFCVLVFTVLQHLRYPM